MTSCSLQAQRLCPPRSPVGEKEFAKKLACGACPAPANATPPHTPRHPLRPLPWLSAQPNLSASVARVNGRAGM